MYALYLTVFLLPDQTFVAHRVKLKELKTEKERAIMTLIVQKKTNNIKY